MIHSLPRPGLYARLSRRPDGWNNADAALEPLHICNDTCSEWSKLV